MLNGDNFKGLTIKGRDINIKLVGYRCNVETLLDYLSYHDIIELEKREID